RHRHRSSFPGTIAIRIGDGLLGNRSASIPQVLSKSLPASFPGGIWGTAGSRPTLVEGHQRIESSSARGACLGRKLSFTLPSARSPMMGSHRLRSRRSQPVRSRPVRHGSRLRPRLEVLEDRITPSSVDARDVLTFHNDNFRSGANTHETVLTPANVNSA